MGKKRYPPSRSAEAAAAKPKKKAKRKEKQETWTMASILERLMKGLAGKELVDLRELNGFKGRWDLRRVKERLERKKYKEDEERFAEDVRKVCRDARSFFPKHYFKYEYAQCVQSDLEKYWEKYLISRDPELKLAARISQLEHNLSKALIELERQERTSFKQLSAHNISKLTISITRLSERDLAELEVLLPANVRRGRDGRLGFDLSHLLVKDYNALREFLATHKQRDRPAEVQPWFGLNEEELPEGLMESSSESEESSEEVEVLEERLVVSALP